MSRKALDGLPIQSQTGCVHFADGIGSKRASSGSPHVLRSNQAEFVSHHLQTLGFPSLSMCPIIAGDLQLSALMSDANIALVEDGALLGSRQLDMGNLAQDDTGYGE